MRTTLDIEDDVLHAAKELARSEGVTAGQVISKLARRGLSLSNGVQKKPSRSRNGVPLLPSRGDVITLEHIHNLMDLEGM
ncbi:MAG: CopG family transcriptional regulator [Blastocatellia bacterium]